MDDRVAVIFKCQRSSKFQIEEVEFSIQLKNFIGV
jgi:hypothetical protein